MPPLTIMLKPASSLCNLNCKYCFYKDVAANRSEASYGLMTYDTLDVILAKSFSYATDWLAIAFQGGEPTLAGLDFYRHVITLVEKYNVKHLPIHYSIQTNGYQLNKEWALFFHDNHFLVGLSIDGTIHTHDIYRKNSSGNGTFLEIMKTVDLLNLYNVDFNILTVVTNEIASSIQKIYKFYQKNNFQFLQFIPCLQPFDNPNFPNLISKEAYGRFLCDLFDLWYDDVINGKIISIRQFENYIMMLSGHQPESCDMAGHCNIQYIFESNGDIYPCDFYVLDNYKLGNIFTDSFESILSSLAANEFLSQGEIGHLECQNCEYAFLCRGGCRRHKQMAVNNEPNFFCESYKTFFAHSLERMNVLAKMVQ